MKLLERFIPTNSEQFIAGNVTAYLYDKDARPILLAYVGKSGKSRMHVRYKTAKDRQDALDRLVSDCYEVQKIKDDRKSRAKNLLKDNAMLCCVGDIFRSSWGYDQTNIDYYQVIAIKGCVVTVREIAANVKYEGSMSGKCTPDVDNFTGKPMIKRLQARSAKDMYFKVDHTWASKVFKDAHGNYSDSYWSSYA